MSRLLRSLPNKTFLFYGLKRTEPNPILGQIIQFDAIRTTPDFDVLHRHTIPVKLNPDVIPRLSTLIDTRLSIGELQENKRVNEYEAMKQIQALMSEPGTMRVGCRSMASDERSLQHIFQRNFLSPCMDHRENACGSMDIYSMMVAFYLLRSNSLEKNVSGVIPGFTLDNMHEVTYLFSNRAQGNLSEVERTHALAAFLHEGPLRDFCIQFFKTREWLIENPDELTKVREHFLNQRDKREDIDASWQSDQSFDEKFLIEEFHKSDLIGKRDMLDKFKSVSQRKQAVYLLRKNYPDLALSPRDLKTFNDHVKNIFYPDGTRTPSDVCGNRQYSLVDAQAELKKFVKKKDLNAEQKSISKEYAAWLESAKKRAAAETVCSVGSTLFNNPIKPVKTKHLDMTVDQLPLNR